MEIKVTIDKKANLRRHVVTGRLSGKDLHEALSSIYKGPDFVPDMNVLWDLRGAEVSEMSSSDIEEVSELVSRHWGKGGSSRAAIVVSQDFEFGLSRMYQVFLESRMETQIRVFRSIDEAEAWIES
jgi:hypothetical protein